MHGQPDNRKIDSMTRSSQVSVFVSFENVGYWIIYKYFFSFVRYVKANIMCVLKMKLEEISFISIFCNERKILPQLITLYYLHHFASSIYCSCISSYNTKYNQILFCNWKEIEATLFVLQSSSSFIVLLHWTNNEKCFL